jgi:hypothetical protein
MFRPCPKVIARPDVKHKPHTEEVHLQQCFCGAWESLTSQPSFILFLIWLESPTGPRAPHCRGFEITFRLTTLERTPLDDWSARRRDLYLTTHNTHKRKTSMPPAAFEPTTGCRLQTLDRMATGSAPLYCKCSYLLIIRSMFNRNKSLDLTGINHWT